MTDVSRPDTVTAQSERLKHMRTPVRFKVLHDNKAIEALVWLANAKPGISFYHVVKVLFFADKIHLNRYGRPILGDQYIAMEHGPVPSRVYDMLKRDAFIDPETTAIIETAVAISGSRPPTIDPHANRRANLDVFSESDIECLQESLDQYGLMSFRELRELTHRERSYLQAPSNGPMDFVLMIDEANPHREMIEKNIQEFASVLAF